QDARQLLAHAISAALTTAWPLGDIAAPATAAWRTDSAAIVAVSWLRFPLRFTPPIFVLAVVTSLPLLHPRPTPRRPATALLNSPLRRRMRDRLGRTTTLMLTDGRHVRPQQHLTVLQQPAHAQPHQIARREASVRGQRRKLAPACHRQQNFKSGGVVHA